VISDPSKLKQIAALNEVSSTGCGARLVERGYHKGNAGRNFDEFG